MSRFPVAYVYRAPVPGHWLSCDSPSQLRHICYHAASRLWLSRQTAVLIVPCFSTFLMASPRALCPAWLCCSSHLKLFAAASQTSPPCESSPGWARERLPSTSRIASFVLLLWHINFYLCYCYFCSRLLSLEGRAGDGFSVKLRTRAVYLTLFFRLDWAYL